MPKVTQKPKGVPRGTDSQPVIWFFLTPEQRSTLAAESDAVKQTLLDYCKRKLLAAKDRSQPRGQCSFRLGDAAEFVIRRELTPEEAKKFSEVAALSAEGMTRKDQP